MSGAKRRQQPPQQPPPVQRLRLRYAKRERARFMSHRDFSRAFERALRRAVIPMAYSSGFNPHPRLSFANAVPTGAATEADFVEIGLAQQCDPAEVMAALNAALPMGLSIEEARESDGRSLMDRLTASEWQIQLRQVDDAALTRAVHAFEAADSIAVERLTKKGMRTFDARVAVEVIDTVASDTIRVVLHHTAPLVRPDDVVNALIQLEPLVGDAEPPLLTRLAQGRWHGGRIVGPFDQTAF